MTIQNVNDEIIKKFNANNYSQKPYVYFKINKNDLLVFISNHDKSFIIDFDKDLVYELKENKIHFWPRSIINCRPLINIELQKGISIETITSIIEILEFSI